MTALAKPRVAPANLYTPVFGEPPAPGQAGPTKLPQYLLYLQVLSRFLLN